ncbi:hypothetical protein ABIE58_003782 [Roseovarius sp. MBR-78]|jgi:hypothetical protein
MKRTRFTGQQIIGILAEQMLDLAAMKELVAKKW